MNKLNILLILLLSFCAGCVSAQKETPLIVRGQLNQPNTEAVGLYRSVDGFWECIATSKLDGEGNYLFAVSAPRTELLAIGFDFNTGTNNKALFCGKNGDEIELYSPEKLEKYTFRGTVSNNNRILEQWEQEYQRVLPDNTISNTFRELYPKVDGFLKTSKEQASKVKSDDPEFDAFLKLFIETQALFGLTYFHFLPATSFPSAEERLPLLSILNESLAFDSPLYARMPFCSVFVACVEGEMAIQKKGKLDLEQAADEVKINYFLSKMQNGQYRDYWDFSPDYEKYGKLISEKSQLKKVEDYIRKSGFTAVGKPATDFTYHDLNGKPVSLSDFKGKVVVVDVWATWCGPCKAEIPHLKKLEKEFEGREDLVFLAVSVDKAKDKEAWKKMIADQKMGGIHLFADGFSEIAKSYQINAIPRFMVFDKKGNIVSTNSPRPSDPKLKTMIENELKK